VAIAIKYFEEDAAESDADGPAGGSYKKSASLRSDTEQRISSLRIIYLD